MKLKKILSALLSGVIAFSAVAASAAQALAAKSGSKQVSVSRVWNGSYDTKWFTKDKEKDSYDIYTAEQLAGLAYICDNDPHEDRFNGVTINLMADITLNDTSNFKNWDKKPPKNLWEPIGTIGTFLQGGYRPFAGTFNGNGHTISGMYTKVYNRNLWYGDNGLSGLFECLCGAQIVNLRMEKCYSESNADAGIIAGCAQGTIIQSVELDNCRVVASNRAGGFVGYVHKFILSTELSVLTYFTAAAVTGMFFNPILFGDSYISKDPTSTFFYACKVTNSTIGGGDRTCAGGLAGGSDLPTGVAYCLIANNVFGQNVYAAPALAYYPDGDDNYLVINTYSYNNKNNSSKNKTFTDSKLVKTVKQSAISKSSFVKKLNKDFFEYKKGGLPKLKSTIETPVDVVLQGTKAKISWEKVNNAVSYKVYRKNSSGEYKLISTTKNTTANLKNINKGTEHNILIRAYYKDGKYDTVKGGSFTFEA